MDKLSLGLAVAYLFAFVLFAVSANELPRIMLLRGVIVLFFMASVMRVLYEFLRNDK